MMYIANLISNPLYYWCLDDTKGAECNGESIQEAFNHYYKKKFNYHVGKHPFAKYVLNGGIIERRPDRDIPVNYARIIASFPNNTTYSQFVELFPELLV